MHSIVQDVRPQPGSLARLGDVGGQLQRLCQLLADLARGLPEEEARDQIPHNVQRPAQRLQLRTAGTPGTGTACQLGKTPALVGSLKSTNIELG